MTVEALRTLLAAYRYRFNNERELQEGIQRVLDEAKVGYAREVSLGRKDIIDFVIDGHLGVEVKIQETLSNATRQLHRYAQSDQLDALVFATTSLRLCHALPRTLNGKRVLSVALNGGGIL